LLVSGCYSKVLDKEVENWLTENSRLITHCRNDARKNVLISYKCSIMPCCILPEYTLYATSSQDGTKDTFPLR